MNVVEARRGIRRRQRATRTSDGDRFVLDGGLNLVDPVGFMREGFCIAAHNYEIGVNGGYERLGGYERFDGRASPSSAEYYVLVVRHKINLTAYIQQGQTVTGSGGGSGTVLTAVELTEPGINVVASTEDLAGIGATNGAVAQVSIDPPKQAVYGVTPTGWSYNYVSRLLAPVTAFEFVENTSNAGHRCRVGAWSSNDLDPSSRLRASIYVKQRDAARRYVMLATDSFVAAYFTVAPQVIFDLEAGTVVSSNAGVLESSIEPVGNGWFRISFASAGLASNPPNGFVYEMELRCLDANQAETYVGDGVSGVYFTGANASHLLAETPPLLPYSHAYASGNTPAGLAYIVLSAVPSAFNPLAGGVTQDDLLDAASTVIGTYSGAPQKFAAPTLALHLDYKSRVAELARAAIAKVPGGGPIRGVWLYNGKVFAFRDDAATGATQTRMYRSSGSGWAQITFSNHLDFDAGLAAGETNIVEGATVNGLTSGASATVLRINLTNSNWAGNAAVGTLVLGTITGTFQNNETLRVGGTNVATIDGVAYVPTWDDGGTYRFRTHNFYGASDKRRMYGVNGLNRVFEYDDNDGVLASYRTGMTVDQPTHIAVDKQTLMLGFRGGSWQNSGVGRPAVWSAVTGAAEIGVGDDFTGVVEEAGGSLFLFTRSQTFQLTGNIGSLVLQRFQREAGCLQDTVQRIGMGIHLDDRGFSSLVASDRFGNYEANTFSQLIAPLVSRLLRQQVPTASVIHRTGNRYRCFFDDGSFVSIGVRGTRIAGHMLCDYGRVVRAICSEEDADGRERMFFGSDDGYIYEAERGTSFDGEPIEYSIRPAYFTSGRPDRRKTYRSARIEGIARGQVTLKAKVDLSFGKTILPERDLSVEASGAIWDNAMEWERFDWDTKLQNLKEMRIGAEGTNIGMVLYGSSSVEEPHTLRAIVFQTTLRGLQRSTRVG